MQSIRSLAPFSTARHSRLQRSTPLLGALLLSMLALALAFQPASELALDLGGELRRSPAGGVEAASYDRPYLAESFHGPEPARLGADTAETFRWTLPQSQVAVPALGPGPWLVTLRANSGRVDGTPAELRIEAGQPLLQVQVPAAWRTARFLVPDRGGAGARFSLHTPAYQPEGDARPLGPLGIVVDRIAIQQQGWRPWLPLQTWSLLAGTLLLLALGGLLAGLRSEAVALGALGLGAVGALALLQWRATLTIFAPMLFGSTLAALLLMLLLGALGSRLAQRSSLVRAEIWPLAGLIALAWLIRLAGLLHPQQIASDTGMHVNNLFWLGAAGEVIFTEPLPCEAGLRPAPYPPAFYILLAPILPLVRDHHLLLEAGTALADALVIGAIWAIVRQTGGSQRAALLGGALYLAPTAMLYSLGVGEMANVGGQALAMIVVALALPLIARPGSPGSSALLVLLLTLGFLGHTGVAALLGLLVVCWSGLLLLTGQRRAGLQLLLAGGAAGLLAALLYYSAFIGDPALAGFTPNPNCPPQLALSEKLYWQGYEVTKLWSLTPPALLALGLAGALLARRHVPQLGLLLLAWWLTSLLSLSTLLFSAQTLRWQHFLYPALAAAGGLLLSLAWERGRLQRLGAAALLGIAQLYGLIFWIHHIATKLHFR